MWDRKLDQRRAIMIAIDHLGDIKPGQKCSAVFCDAMAIQQERAFYEKFCSENGMTNPSLVEAMVSSQVPSKPYWLVSFKPVGSGKMVDDKEIRYCKVDDDTGTVIRDAPF